MTAAASAVIAAVACGSGSSDDAPAPGADGTSPDAGLDAAGSDVRLDAKGGPKNLLVKGDILLLGVTSDGYAIYRSFDVVTGKYSLWAVGVSGEPPLQLSSDLGGGDFVGRVINSGVGFWTGIGPEGLGTFNVWTKAYGLKSAPGARSYKFFFTVPPGGDTVVFASSVSDGGLVDGSVLNINVAVAPLADLTALTIFDDVNIVAMYRNCPASTITPNNGNSIFLVHCTGTDPDQFAGRIALVKHHPDGGFSKSVVVSEKSAATAIVPYFRANADLLGNRLLVAGAQPFAEGRVVDVATGVATVLDPEAVGGVIAVDGGTIYYTSQGALRRASPDGKTKITLVDGGADHLRALSDDERHLLYASIPAAITDLRIADNTTPNQTPKTLTPDASVRSAGFNVSGDQIIYATIDPATGTGDCYLVHPDGTGARKVASGVSFCDRFFATNVGIVQVNPHLVGPFLARDIQTIDLASATAVAVDFEKDVTQLQDAWNGRVAFVKVGVEAGLYVRSLP
jgi:hypothetical protein